MGEGVIVKEVRPGSHAWQGHVERACNLDLVPGKSCSRHVGHAVHGRYIYIYSRYEVDRRGHPPE